jgi:hypothetical protein
MPTQTGTLPVPGVLKGVGGPPGKVTRTRPRGSVAWTQAGPLPRVSPLQKPPPSSAKGARTWPGAESSAPTVPPDFGYRLWTTKFKEQAGRSHGALEALGYPSGGVRGVGMTRTNYTVK